MTTKLTEPTENTLDFLSSLFEARMTRDSGDHKVLTYTDCSERLYITLLILQLLNQYPTYRQLASRYAKDTKHSNYNRFRMYSTDLYNFVYFVTGDDEALNKLKDPEGAKKIRKNITFPVMGFNRFLTELQTGIVGKGNLQLFLNIESKLKINNTSYKTIRRDLFNWSTVNERNQAEAVTKLLFAARAKLRNSDIIDDIEKLASDRNLEVSRVKDNEPKISTPDISTASQDIALYRYLVGAENLIGVKRFLEYAMSGKSIPNTIVKAYLPAIKIIDDLVQAGPGFVSMLRALATRAQKQKK